MLLRLFGAVVEKGAHPYPAARIWAPWNLVMRADSGLADGVDCYNVAEVEIGPRATVSQRAFLCTASHDYNSKDMALVAAPIFIGADAWVAAEAFLAPGVAVGPGAVVLARSVVTRDVPERAVVRGNPASVVSQRKITADRVDEDSICTEVH